MKHLLLFAALAVPALACAQGQLTPPDGAVGPRGPVPTMKTLRQVEPRTLVRPDASGVEFDQNTGYRITASGSYYLDTNLSVSSGNAITIVANDVTLDLNGYLIVSFAGDGVDRGAGIKIDPDVSNVTIRNGHIRGTSTFVDSTFTAGGFDYGISAPTTASNIVVESIGVVGVVQSGINLSCSSAASHCKVSVCGKDGINARIVRDCVVERCVGMGINAEIAANCVAEGAGGGMWVDTATSCRGSTRSANGLRATTAENCYGDSVSGTGLFAETASNCYASTTSGPVALYVRGTANNCRGNHKGSGLAIAAHIGVACTAESGSISVSYRYNMP